MDTLKSKLEGWEGIITCPLSLHVLSVSSALILVGLSGVTVRKHGKSVSMLCHAVCVCLCVKVGLSVSCYS